VGADLLGSCLAKRSIWSIAEGRDHKGWAGWKCACNTVLEGPELLQNWCRMKLCHGQAHTVPRFSCSCIHCIGVSRKLGAIRLSSILIIAPESLQQLWDSLIYRSPVGIPSSIIPSTILSSTAYTTHPVPSSSPVDRISFYSSIISPTQSHHTSPSQIFFKYDILPNATFFSFNETEEEAEGVCIVLMSLLNPFVCLVLE
jgi:hypothetical protein